jgi:GNAT superfamily N-acetyltransferase
MIEIKEIRTLEQAQQLANVCEPLVRERLPMHPYSASKVVASCLTIIHDLDRSKYNAWIALVDGKPAGGLSAAISEYMYSYEVYASDHLFFVLPEYRKTRVLFRLIREYEEWARLNGAVEILLTVLRPGDEMEAVLAQFPRIGYQHAGAVFYKSTCGRIRQ